MHALAFRYGAIGISIAAALLTPPAMAQTASSAKPATEQKSEPATTTATYGDWMLRCVRVTAEPADTTGKSSRSGDATSCEIVQSVQIQGQQQPVLQLAVGYLPNDKALTMTAVLPVNVSLSGMAHISGNGKAGADEKAGIDLSWVRCVGGACFAGAKPDEKKVAELRVETAGNLQFTQANGQTIAIPLSWKGLDSALKALNGAM